MKDYYQYFLHCININVAFLLGNKFHHHYSDRTKIKKKNEVLTAIMNHFALRHIQFFPCTLKP